MNNYETIKRHNVNMEFISNDNELDIDIEMSTCCYSCTTTTGQITLTLDEVKALHRLLSTHIINAEPRFPNIKDAEVIEL